jgi:hypothetical protein
MKTLARLLLVLAAVSLVSTTAHADVTYDFHAVFGFSNNQTVNISVTTADFITAVTTFTPGDPGVSCTLSGGYTCSSLTFNPFYTDSDPDHAQLYFFSNASGGETDLYYFSVGAFATPGVYSENLCPNDCTGRGAVLTVAEVTAETPEPGSLVLLGSGLMGLGGAVRRKLVR